MSEKKMQIRQIISDLQTREEDGELYLEGYFITYDKVTELWPGVYEEIYQNACSKTLDNDIRALTNHDTTLILGRNKANTLILKEDEKGLWGKVRINKDDSDAVNIYHRVKRGDVSGNSFGGYFLEEEVVNGEDGSVKWGVKEIDLREVSICTFPQYEETSIQARKKDFDQHEKRQIEVRKNKLKERLGKIC
ncbi:MAG TPA: HK97 family phage prohead protease [Epulopiscium sp.]|nr:HK97 family phage prohead protease [Candidatus Epulonipiscium sp.]